MDEYVVERQGRPSANRRVLYKGKDETRARFVYNREETAMRQGAIWLKRITPWFTEIVAESSAPMVRTRW